ncbi:VOC family protein [Actinomadura roseirufa]|uniref:VOC family protein n=1 Tax=Actinomadura roseirufa TaxID=2094049 RepID=UPI001040F02C|nr:VOC family protein [Actinomadura roseirufa]
MPEVTQYTVGAPCWLDLSTPDMGISRHFYSELFGWSSYTLSGADFYTDYEMFTLGGVQGPEVAGAQELLDDTLPPTWTCYFRTESAEDAGEVVAAAGGQTTAEVRDVAHLGRMAQFADTQGADFAVWEPLAFQGAAVWADPSAMRWAELVSPDTVEARRFYGEVFGWTAEERGYHRSGYIVWHIGEQPVAGMVPMDEFWPADHPPHWMPYFTVSDCDVSASRAVELGARLRVPPTDVLGTARFSVMNDPTGARLAIVSPYIDF